MSDLNGLLDLVAEDVLENMFFSGIMGEMPEKAGTDDADGDRLFATVAFSGSSDGRLSVSAPASTAAVLAAGVVGAEDGTVSESQVRAVVGELANVFCGAVLGRMNPDGHFVISTPEVSETDGGNAVLDMEVHRHFEIVEGDLAVGLTVH